LEAPKETHLVGGLYFSILIVFVDFPFETPCGRNGKKQSTMFQFHVCSQTARKPTVGWNNFLIFLLEAGTAFSAGHACNASNEATQGIFSKLQLLLLPKMTTDIC